MPLRRQAPSLRCRAMSGAKRMNRQQKPLESFNGQLLRNELLSGRAFKLPVSPGKEAKFGKSIFGGLHSLDKYLWVPVNLSRHPRLFSLSSPNALIGPNELLIRPDIEPPGFLASRNIRILNIRSIRFEFFCSCFRWYNLLDTRPNCVDVWI
jgi:hypothetical protein